jgi:trans-2,3-dihydro-3-hydroxyanthranilate isomerase
VWEILTRFLFLDLIMKRAYFHVDVFTQIPLAGNPLTIVTECEGLDERAMMDIAREFNQSETVFVFPPEDPVHTARLRIFTPMRELNFAGHPIIGTAALLASQRVGSFLAQRDVSVVFELADGPLECAVKQTQRGILKASFILPQIPKRLYVALNSEVIASALGLAPSDIGFDGHEPCVFSISSPYVFVPIANLAAMGRVKPNAARWREAFPTERSAVYLYTGEVELEGSAVHARMFVPAFGLTEDPATGAAAAAFAGVIMEYESIGDGDHRFIIEQGFEIGRPSLISLGVEVKDNNLSFISLAGHVVPFAQGHIDI